MAKVYLTFDPYYDIANYNEFIAAAKNNYIEYAEFISIMPPHNWYIQVDIENVPRFLNYDLGTSSVERYLVNRMQPRYQNEAVKLLRRESDTPKDFERFVTPAPLIQAKDEAYVCFFSLMNKEAGLALSKELGNTKIWRLGAKTQRKGYVYMTFNPYVKGLIPASSILMEKTSKGELNKAGELEQQLNYKVLVTEKIEGKGMELEYFQDGKFFPLKAPYFL